MTLRQEIHNCINDISEKKLLALKPLLFALLEDSITIETNLTDEEKLLIDLGLQEYKNNPSNFIPLDALA